jgi:hypothetical protein
MVERGVLLVGVWTTGDPLYAGNGVRQHDMVSFSRRIKHRAAQVSGARCRSSSICSRGRDQRQWVTEVARKRGLMVTAENDDLEYTIGMAMDGHTGFEHPLSYLPVYGDLSTFLGKAGITYSGDQTGGRRGPWNEEYWYVAEDTWKDEKAAAASCRGCSLSRRPDRMLRPATDYSFPFIAQAIADVVARVATAHRPRHASTTAPAGTTEVWMLASAMPPVKARSSREPPRSPFHRPGARPRLTRGRQAGRLLVLNSNPLTDIGTPRDMMYVMKGGVLYDDETLDEVWPRRSRTGGVLGSIDRCLKSDDKPLRP